VGTPNGQRPDPSDYMSQADIDAHLARFDDGAVRFTSQTDVENYGTAVNSKAFVMQKSEFYLVVAEARE
jgi:filamentous hemagglutinin